MLDGKDITILREMFSKNNCQLTRQIQNEVHSLIIASEKRVIGSIAEILDISILPQIADLQRDMTLVKQHLQLA